MEGDDGDEDDEQNAIIERGEERRGEAGRRNAARTLAQAQWDRVLEARRRRKRSKVDETRVKSLNLCDL